MSWRPGRRWLRRTDRRADRAAQSELRFLREQVASLQHATLDLVSAADIDTVLARIAGQASSAVRAQRSLLAVHLGRQLRVQATGFDERTARRLGARLLAEPQGPARRDGCLVAEVASARSRYGRLAAYFPPGHAPLAAEQELWDAYARLAATALDTSTALADARCRGETAETLLQLGRQLAAAEEPDEVAQRVAVAVPGLTGADLGTVLLWDAGAGQFTVRGVHGYEPLAEAGIRAMAVTPAHTPALAAMLRHLGPLLCRRDTADPWIRQLQERSHTNTLALVPIVLRTEVLGVAAAGWTTSPAPRGDAELFGRLAGLADQAATALGNAQLVQEARHAATHDALTNLPNRALLADRLARAEASRRRTGGGFGVLFVDLDGFKAINDRWGHTVGDAVLRQVAMRLLASVRATDTVGRYGGDEFLVLLSDIGDRGDAELVASTLLTALAPPIVVDGHSVDVSASLGLAVSFGDLGPEELLRRADAAMYRVKSTGGDDYGSATGDDYRSATGVDTATGP